MSSVKDFLGGAVTTLLGPLLDTPKAPKVEKPKVAPDPDDVLQRQAQEKEMTKKYGKSGRVGTILSGMSSKLG